MTASACVCAASTSWPALLTPVIAVGILTNLLRVCGRLISHQHNPTIKRGTTTQGTTIAAMGKELLLLPLPCAAAEPAVGLAALTSW